MKTEIPRRTYAMWLIGSAIIGTALGFGLEMLFIHDFSTRQAAGLSLLLTVVLYGLTVSDHKNE